MFNCWLLALYIFSVISYISVSVKNDSCNRTCNLLSLKKLSVCILEKSRSRQAYQGLCDSSALTSGSQVLPASLLHHLSYLGFCLYAYHLTFTMWLLHLQLFINIPGKEKGEVETGKSKGLHYLAVSLFISLSF